MIPNTEQMIDKCTEDMIIALTVGAFDDQGLRIIIPVNNFEVFRAVEDLFHTLMNKYKKESMRK